MKRLAVSAVAVMALLLSAGTTIAAEAEQLSRRSR